MSEEIRELKVDELENVVRLRELEADELASVSGGCPCSECGCGSATSLGAALASLHRKSI